MKFFFLLLIIVAGIEAGVRFRRHPMALRYGQNNDDNQEMDDLAWLREDIGSQLARLLAKHLEEQKLSLSTTLLQEKPHSPPAFFPLLKSGFLRPNSVIRDANENNYYYDQVGQDLGRSPTAL